jgi:DDE superfamily endonuclease
MRLAAQHPEWVLGFQDETGWSRLAQPLLSNWSEGAHPLRWVERVPDQNDPTPKALACYGLLLREYSATGEAAERVWLRFVKGQPVSDYTIQFLDWCGTKLAACGKRALLMIWDKAPWQVSQPVRTWLREHNREVKRTGHGLRLVASWLPSKSPWLNPIEPKWAHGKRRVLEPERVLSADELTERVCQTFQCDPEPPLVIPKNVS